MHVEVDHVEVDRVEVDTAGITTAAIHLAEQADRLRQHRFAADRLADPLTDPRLRAGTAALADVVSDVLELLTQDLELLSTKVCVGARLYDATERAVQGAMAGGGGG